MYDNPDISIGEAMEAILSDEGISMTACKVMDYEELQEKAEAAAQEDLQKAQAKETEKGKLPLVSDMTEPEPALNSQSRAGTEETVLCYAQAQIDEMGLSEEVELLGARVYGSRTREGLYHEGSDIDVVVSYSGNLKEDAFFSALHEDGLKIAGIPVDINPISTEKTGTLEEYLENAEKYLDEKQGYMEILESNGRADRKQSITFYVAECSEFHILGEFHECLETLQEAMELYEKIPADRLNGIKSIGIQLEDDSIYDGTTYDLMVAGEIQTEFINEIPHYRESPLVQKAIADMEAMLLEQRTGQEVSAPEEKAALPQQTMPEVKEGKAVQMEENRNPATEVRKSVGDTEVSEKQPAELKKAAENAPQNRQSHIRRQQEAVCLKCPPGTAGKNESAGEGKTGTGKIGAEGTGKEERRTGIMMVRFEENEYFLMAMFQKESRQATIEEIYNVIPYIGRDEEMLALINSTLEKLWFLTDEAFLNMDLEPYKEELVEDE